MRRFRVTRSRRRIKLVLNPQDMTAPLGPDGKPVPPLITGKEVARER